MNALQWFFGVIRDSELKSKSVEDVADALLWALKKSETERIFQNDIINFDALVQGLGDKYDRHTGVKSRPAKEYNEMIFVLTEGWHQLGISGFICKRPTHLADSTTTGAGERSYFITRRGGSWFEKTKQRFEKIKG